MKKKKEVWTPQFETTIFRNDDVFFDTNLEHFKEFCEVFHKHGYTQLHAVTLYGCCNDKYVIDGMPCLYNTIKPLDIYDYESCKKVSTDFIGDNKELIDYLNSIPDEIGLHGLYHSNYSAMSYEKQEHDIKEGLRLLHELFPNKIIRTFIAPFNMTNEYTYEICEKYGLRVSALEGEHLEEMIHNNSGTIRFGQLYRYHHHRFYPESTFKYYDLSIMKLDSYLEKFCVKNGVLKNKKNRKPKILLLCDRPNWAHHNSAIEIVNQLSDEFDFDIKYVINNEKINSKNYDAILVFFWGEESYKKWHFPKRKIIKQVSSHRWQDNPLYGPLTPKEFEKKYLSDCKTVICPSKILYDLLDPCVKNLFLCGKGYNPVKFHYLHERTGEMKLCMVGNLKDPVKGVEDLLKPASDGFILNLANELKHEELCEFYNQNDIYVVSSRNEADPLPLIESMACGCFPVASYVGIAPELIRHKENGYLVKNRTVEEFRNAFEWCKANLSYIRQQGKKNAKELYEKRRWEIMAENYRRMFRSHLNIS